MQYYIEKLHNKKSDINYDQALVISISVIYDTFMILYDRTLVTSISVMIYFFLCNKKS